MTTHPAASGKMSSRVAPSSTNRCRSPRRDTYGHAGSRPPGSRRPGEKRLIHGGTGRRPLIWHPGAVEPPSDRAADQAPPKGPSQRPTAASVMLHGSPHRWRPCPAQASPDQHMTTHMLLVSDGSLPLVHAEFRYRCADPSGYTRAEDGVLIELRSAIDPHAPARSETSCSAGWTAPGPTSPTSTPSASPTFSPTARKTPGVTAPFLHRPRKGHDDVRIPDD